MKLEQYKDKKAENKKILTISIGVVLLISVSLLLYKTFAIFKETMNFPFMSGQVDYFGNSDVYFVFYKGNDMLNSMPQKGNEENLVFERGECNKGASIEWDAERWAPLVKDLNQTKTECKIYFKEQKDIVLGKDILPIESGDGLYAVTHDDLEGLGQEWNQTEYRYAGEDPDNYVSFNNEIWRIIGLVNVKVGDNVEQRVKIVRQDGVKEQKDFGLYAWDKNDLDYSNNWTISQLKNMLNGIYYGSEIGECYTGKRTWDSSELLTCDFRTGDSLTKGLDEEARKMVDKEVIWNIGGSSTNNDVTVKMFYERERGMNTGSKNGVQYPSEWNSTTDVGNKYNSIALIYPSDYGYATNGGSIGREKCFSEYLYNWNKTVNNINYKNECSGTNWLRPKDLIWTLLHCTYRWEDVFVVSSYGKVSDNDDSVMEFSMNVWPTLYLTISTKIVDGTGDINSPFVLSQN